MLAFRPDAVNVDSVGGAEPRRRSVLDLARMRYSCRAYVSEPIAPDRRAQIEALLSSIHAGPFGTAVRFRLVAATENDARALRGLGTYGFIAGVTAFVVGAADRGERDLEDFGHAMERVILGATALGLATCWLGGSFTRSRFARAIGAATWESVPAVAAVGRAAAGSEQGWIRRRIVADHRKPWSELFFDEALGTALTPEQAGAFGPSLEAVRLAPSASNKQPWRIVRQGKGRAWQFHLQRTPGYGKGSLTFRLLRLADLQRVDMGIAMCHFELAARESGLSGRWIPSTPGVAGARTEQVVTWIAE